MKKGVLRISKSKWRHIPNILTMLRLAIVPVVAVLMISEEWIWSLVLFVVAEFTDILDGYIARKYKFISNFGKLADPLADKLLQLTVLLLLSASGKLPSYFFLVLCIKELAMILGALFFLKKDVVVSSNWVGKAASAIIFAGIVLALLNFQISKYLLLLGIAVSLAAGIVYLVRYLHQMKNKSE